MGVRWRGLVALIAFAILSGGCRQDNPVIERPPPTANAATPAESP